MNKTVRKILEVGFAVGIAVFSVVIFLLFLDLTRKTLQPG